MMIVFALVMFALGIGILGFGQYMFWTRILARLRGEVLEGEIVNWHRVRVKKAPGSSSASRSMFQPSVEFIDTQGQTRTNKLWHQYTPGFREANPIGSKMKVLFDPKYPDRSLDTTWTTAFVLPAILTVAGSLVALIGLGIAFGK